MISIEIVNYTHSIKIKGIFNSNPVYIDISKIG